MFSPKDQIRHALNITMVVSLYGIACLLIFFLGDWAGISLPYQIVLVALILLTWPFAIAINHARKRREQQQSGKPSPPRARSGAKAEAGRAKFTAPVRANDELTRGAEEAVQWLNSTKLADAKSNEAIYKLPWFVIAGPARSGKTSLLLSSGLDYQALPSQRRADLNLIRPTRDAVWRVTDSAINIDSAGRYQAEGPDGEQWSTLVETIKKHRRNRPIDGLVIAVDASRLLKGNDADIEQQAKILRARLDEAIQRAQARFPVYLVFTHTDAIDGFAEFFSPFDRDERAQVWGATIPLEQSQTAHALFDVEFDHLYDGLLRRRLVRLGTPAPAAEQLRVFNFPLAFAESRRKLGLFTSALFRPNPFSENPLLRGFYFTSSAADEKSRAKPQSAVVKSGVTTATLIKPAVAVEEKVEEPKAAGRGYFSESLFKDVLQRDKDLAQSFLLNRKRPFPIRNALAAAAATILLLFMAGVFASYFGNRRLVDEARERGLRVEEINRVDSGKDSAKKTAVDAAVEMNAIEDLRKVLVELDNYEKNSPPLFMRFWLYSGNEINPHLRAVYFDAIDRQFYKPVVAAIERDLRALTSTAAPAKENAAANAGNEAGNSNSTNNAQASEPASDLGRYYDLLKTYLMLSNVEKVEPAFLQNQLAEYWKKAAPSPDLELLGEEQLKFFAWQAGRDDASHYKPDDKLVADARRKLQAYPAADRLFKQLISSIDARVPAITLDGVVRDRGRGALVGAYAVPGSFTLKGYHEHWLKAVESAGDEISKDDWVMGSEATASKDQSADLSRLQSMYFRAYTEQWRKFLKGVSVRPFKTKADAVDALRAFAASDSPMELLMLEVRRNTDLSAAPKSGGLFGWIKGLFSSDAKKQAGTTEVEKEFNPLFAFVVAEDKKARVPISEYRATLDQVLRLLEIKTDDQLAQVSKSLLTGKDELGLQKADQEVSRALDLFKTAATRDAARVLTQPLDNLRALLYGGGYEQIDRSWREQLYPRARALEAAFPFADSTADTPVTDLARFLNPVNGQFTAFFNERLATSFEESQGGLKLKESGAVKLSESFVNYLNRARELRDALFAGGGQTPEVSYEIKLQPVAGVDVRIEIDGSTVETRSTSAQAAKFTWPARAGTSGARIVIVKNGQQAEASFPGEWGLFRLFAAGKPTKVADNQFQLSWSAGSITVRATLQPSSATNPFERRLFTQLRAPQGLNE